MFVSRVAHEEENYSMEDEDYSGFGEEADFLEMELGFYSHVIAVVQKVEHS